VSCAQCCQCLSLLSSAHCHLRLSFCVLCPMLPVSIFLCLVPNVNLVSLSVSCPQCYPSLSFCVLCLMLPMSIFLCLETRVTLGTGHRKIDTSNIGRKTQKYRHEQHRAQSTGR
jgi:hypothetical protein